MTTSAEGRWTGRPWLGGALTAAVFALPVAASAASAVIVAHIVSRPARGGGLVWWWATIMASSTIVLLGAARLCGHVGSPRRGASLLTVPEVRLPGMGKVRRSDALGHHHLPRVEHQFAHLGVTYGVEAHTYPVVPEV